MKKNNDFFDSSAIKRLMKLANIGQEKYKEWLANENKLSKKIEKEKSLSFGNATIEKLMEIASSML